MSGRFTSTFNPRAADAAKRHGMAAAAHSANPEWWAFMLDCVVEVARRKPFLFTDDLERLRQARGGPSTSEHRALGPLMMEAKRAGICIPTDHWVPSAQKVNHRRYMRVWYSLIYEGPKVKRPRRRKVIDPRQRDLVLMPEVAE